MKKMNDRNPEETFHAHLRRHYTRISEQWARQLAELEQAMQLETIFEHSSAELSSH
jgi:hypothetical protein